MKDKEAFGQDVTARGDTSVICWKTGLLPSRATWLTLACSICLAAGSGGRKVQRSDKRQSMFHFTHDWTWRKETTKT